LMAMGAFLDIGVQGAVTAVLAGHEGMSMEKTARHYI